MSNSDINHDDIRLKDVVFKLIRIKDLLWAKKLRIIAFALFFGLMGSVYAYFKKDIYEAHLTFVIDESQDAGGLGAISGMASQFGFDLGGKC